MNLRHLSDDQILAGLQSICADSHRLLARMIAFIAEVERRGIHEKAACSSMFDFCQRKLGLSNGATFRRLTAARLVRRFPSILARIESGEVHLEALVELRDHLTEVNVDELLTAVAGKSTRAVEQIVAARFPRPDAPQVMRKLPTPSAAPAEQPATTLALASRALAPSEPILGVPPAPATVAPGPVPAPSPLPRPAAPPRIEPLSAGRHKVQLTVSTDLRRKIERAQDLMRHRNPSGDLEALFDEAMTALLEKLEKERLGKTSRPSTAVRPAKPGHVSRAARREVFARDGEQCTYVDLAGDRCPARGLLELDHIESKALGGSDEASNLRVRCRMHNQLHAKEAFGERHVARQIDFRRRKSERAASPSSSARSPGRG